MPYSTEMNFYNFAFVFHDESKMTLKKSASGWAEPHMTQDLETSCVSTVLVEIILVMIWTLVLSECPTQLKCISIILHLYLCFMMTCFKNTLRNFASGWAEPHMTQALETSCVSTVLVEMILVMIWWRVGGLADQR